MPLLLLDLDNTLIDRDAAFRAAVTDLLAEHGLPAEDIRWIVELDRSGYAPRADVVRALADRYDSTIPHETLVEFTRWGAASYVRPEPTVNHALRVATSSGWTPVVITNGAVAQQTAKLRNAELDKELAGWVISEEVGHKKPAREIFQAAATRGGAELDGAWMIGDAPLADIGGATELGLSNVWLPHGRNWPTDLTYRPTQVAENVTTAVQLVLAYG